jgi:hypothetical protein
MTTATVRCTEARCAIPSKILTGLLLLAAIFAARPVQAADPGPVVVALTAQKVCTSADGQEKLQPAERAFPGDIVQYDASYRNVSGDGVRDLQPTLPIPRGLEFLPESTKPAPALASLDGRTFAAYPLKRLITLPDGRQEEQLVPWSEYRALRWTVGDLPAGQTVTVTVRARLSQSLTAKR